MFNISLINSIYRRKEVLKRLLGEKLPLGMPPGMPPGIKNFGNSCFHNSAVQLFYRMRNLTSFITDPVIKDHYKWDSYISHFIILLQLMQDRSDQSVNRVINDKRILILTKICPIISGYHHGHQQDSNEFLVQILNSLLLSCDNNQLNINLSKLCENNRLIKKFPFNDPRNSIMVEVSKLHCFLDIDLPYDQVHHKKGTPNKHNPNIVYSQDTFDEDLANTHLGSLPDIGEKVRGCRVYEILEKNASPGIFLSVTRQNKDTSVSTLLNRYNIIYKKPKNMNNNYPYVEKWVYKPGEYLIINLVVYETEFDPNTFRLRKKKINHRLTLVNSDGYLEYDGEKYELIGITIHIGVMAAGHYYAYLKYGDSWFQYNDAARKKVNLDGKRIDEYIYNDTHGTPTTLLYQKKLDHETGPLPEKAPLINYLENQ